MNYGQYKSQVQEFTEALKRDGYDGIIYDNEYVIFTSEQAKSATDNRGTFDSNNPDIYYQISFNPRKWFSDWLHGKDIDEREKGQARDVIISSAEPEKVSSNNDNDFSFDNKETERRYIEAKKGPYPSLIY